MMKTTILIVDDDQDMLLALKDGLEALNRSYSVLIAGSAQQAVKKLQNHVVSLIVTDIVMPGIDGLALTAYLTESYPDIPVICVTGRLGDDVREQCLKRGASGFLRKPFAIQELYDLIAKVLDAQNDGGTMRGVAAATFLQVVEMEEKTCTIRVLDKISQRQGVLFFNKGELVEARLNGLRGEEAAREIVSWEDTDLAIETRCKVRQKGPGIRLRSLILDAMRQKDEKVGQNEIPGVGTSTKTQEEPQEAFIKGKIDSYFMGRWSPNRVYKDNSWEDLRKKVEECAMDLGVGKLKTLYVDTGADVKLILVPLVDIIAIEVGDRCPRDTLIKVICA
jgi:CheY-like chemotaxis protein